SWSWFFWWTTRTLETTLLYSAEEAMPPSWAGTMLSLKSAINYAHPNVAIYSVRSPLAHSIFMTSRRPSTRPSMVAFTVQGPMPIAGGAPSASYSTPSTTNDADLISPSRVSHATTPLL